MNMIKMNKFIKTTARVDFQYNTYNNRNDDEYQGNTHEYEDSAEEEEKEGRRREKEKLMK